MQSYVNGDFKKPKNEIVENCTDLLDIWEANNSKVITWINNSVAPSIGMQLAKNEYKKKVWDHLARLYTQFNFEKKNTNQNMIFVPLNKRI